MTVEDTNIKTQKETSQDIPGQEQEEYLFLYVYSIDGIEYWHLDYFHDMPTAEAYFAKTSPPYITSISVKQYPEGYTWIHPIMGKKVKTFYPPTKSEFDRLVETEYFNQPCE
jgi:hypothetical protein